MAAILYIDVLGSRARWQQGGAAASKRVFDEFARLMLEAAGPNATGLVRGGIETDSAALLFASAQDGLEVAQRVYLQAFRTAVGENRVWLRGALVPCESADELRQSRSAPKPTEQVEITTYSSSLLEAISVEKSGFKGMRLLVDRSLLTATVRAAWKLPLRNRTFIPFRHLGHSRYPDRGEFEDFLWMATHQQGEWDDRRIVMATRLRLAGNDSEEFLQAAATQVVFHECNAIIQSLRKRSK